MILCCVEAVVWSCVALENTNAMQCWEVFAAFGVAWKRFFGIRRVCTMRRLAHMSFDHDMGCSYYLDLVTLCVVDRSSSGSPRTVGRRCAGCGAGAHGRVFDYGLDRPLRHRQFQVAECSQAFSLLEPHEVGLRGIVRRGVQRAEFRFSAERESKSGM